MSKYRPVLINTDEEGVKMAKERSNRKRLLFHNAVGWIERNGVITSRADVKLIHRSFVKFFTEHFYESHRDMNLLGLSVEKLMELKEINITELALLESKYKSCELEPEFNSAGQISFPVNLKVFERYTKSSEENAELRDLKKFIQAIKIISKHTHIYPHQVNLATSGAIRYDLAKQEYIPIIKRERF